MILNPAGVTEEAGIQGKPDESNEGGRSCQEWELTCPPEVTRVFLFSPECARNFQNVVSPSASAQAFPTAASPGTQGELLGTAVVR
jgi:hypothetical protein